MKSGGSFEPPGLNQCGAATDREGNFLEYKFFFIRDHWTISLL